MCWVKIVKQGLEEEEEEEKAGGWGGGEVGVKYM